MLRAVFVARLGDRPLCPVARAAHRWMRGPVMGWAALLCALSCPVVAQGERCSDLPSCQTAQQRALRAHEAGEHQAALVAFQTAYELSREPRLLIDIGRTQHHLGAYQRALHSYQQYQHITRQIPPDGEVQQRLPRYVAEARALLPPPKSVQPSSTQPAPVVVVQPHLVVSPQLYNEIHPTIHAPDVHVTVQVPSLSDVRPRDLAPPAAAWYRRTWVWMAVGGVATTALGIGLGAVAYQQLYPLPPISR